MSGHWACSPSVSRTVPLRRRLVWRSGEWPAAACSRHATLRHYQLRRPEWYLDCVMFHPSPRLFLWFLTSTDPLHFKASQCLRSAMLDLQESPNNINIFLWFDFVLVELCLSFLLKLENIQARNSPSLLTNSESCLVKQVVSLTLNIDPWQWPGYQLQWLDVQQYYRV